MPWWTWLGFALGAVAAALGALTDRRTADEKEAAARRNLGYAVGVPTLFDKRNRP